MSETPLPPDNLPTDATATFTHSRFVPHSAGRDRIPDSLPSVTIGGPATIDATLRDDGPVGVEPLEEPAQVPNYILVKPIGRGGMGDVFEAVQTALGRVVAIKRIREDRTAAMSELERIAQEAQFHREALIAARLEHPNIVPVHDFGREAGSPIMAMKLIEGKQWDKILQQDFGTLTLDELLQKHLPILEDMAQAVAFAHSRHIVHRDLKPAQVMIGEFGEVMLTDWGLALLIDQGETAPNASFARIFLPELPEPNSASSPAGTPALMAPEQTRRDANGIGTWTDVYLLGGTLYYILTQSYPHEAATSVMAFSRAAEGMVEPPSVRAKGAAIPPELEELAMACLQRNPENRLRSARDFVSRLRDFLSGASNRREAVELVEKARSAFAASSGSYTELNDCMQMLSRARVLWPRSTDAEELYTRVLTAYAEIALEGNDLRLARVQAERINDNNTRAKLLERVTAAEHRAARAATTRRIAVAATMILLLTVVIGGGWFYWNLREANKATEEEADHARTARIGAERLVSFMIDDFSKELKAIGKLELMDGSLSAMEAHYAALPIRHVSERELQIIGLNITSLGRLHGELGRQDKRLELLGKLEQLAEAQRGTITEASYLTIRDIISRDKATAHLKRGFLGDAERELRASMAILRTLDPKLEEDRTRDVMENTQVSLADILRQRGDFEAAGRLVDEVLLSSRNRMMDGKSDFLTAYAAYMRAAGVRIELLEAANEGAEGLRFMEEIISLVEEHWSSIEHHPEALRVFTTVLDETASAHYRERRLDRAEQMFTRSKGILEGLAAKDPFNIVLVRATIGPDSWLAAIKREQGDQEGALDTFLTLQKKMKFIHDRDPGNMGEALDYARTFAWITQSNLNLERPEEALAAAREGRQFMQHLREQDPGNELVSVSYVTATGDVIRCAARLKLKDEFPALIRDLRDIRDHVLPKFPGSPRIQMEVGTLLTNSAQNAHSLDLWEEALQLTMDAHGILGTLVNAMNSVPRGIMEGYLHSIEWRARSLQSLGRLEEASGIYEELLDKRREFMDWDDPHSVWQLATAYGWSASLHEDLELNMRALELHQLAEALFAEAAQRLPATRNFPWKLGHVMAIRNQGSVRLFAGNRAQALEPVERALRTVEMYLEGEPKNVELVQEHWRTRRTLGVTLLQLEKVEEGTEILRVLEGELLAVLEAEEDNPAALRELSISYMHQALRHVRAERFDDAWPWLEKAVFKGSGLVTFLEDYEADFRKLRDRYPERLAALEEQVRQLSIPKPAGTP